MKIVVAPDSFKGSLSAVEVAKSIEVGIKKVFPRAKVIKVPLADGGEGTVEALVEGVPGSKVIKQEVTGPRGEKVKAFFGILGEGKRAVIEMAAASGLPLVKENKRNPLITTTYGTGELIKAALDYGSREIIVGIGGSATCDGGAGAVQALGVKLLDREHHQIGFGGGELRRIKEIDLSSLDRRIRKSKIIIASDVANPLCGRKGAAYVYAPQKGATKKMVEELEGNLSYYADKILEKLGKKVKTLPGSGAAGGLGAGLIAFLDAKVEPGIELVIQVAKLEEKLKDADLVITAEGKIDAQTAFGKAPLGVAKLAKRHNLPVVAIGGSVSDDAHLLHRRGIDALFSIIRYPLDLSQAMERARELLIDEIEQVMRLVKLEVGTNN
ncbi:MAG: glycerate kinase [Armatimonadetes bacterium CG07_land_8_20_14_0_80_40_9]|nr:MAG: glycerate kinase [Armatimonadetes bacterium CG07_land_8_20_14_0_80_40_9]